MTINWPKAAAYSLLLFLTIVTGAAIIPGRAASVAGNAIVFLQENDPLPSEARLISELRLSATQYSDSCAWFELLLKGSRIAASSGGNLIKILKRDQQHAGGCDALNLAVYRVDNPSNADLAFRWTPGRRLRWADFQGAPPPGTPDRVAAETSCGISVETSLAPATALARVYVFNTFDKRQSWVRQGHAVDAVLRHEQGHWDLCELYTRKMQARFDAMAIRGARLNDVVSKVFDEVERDYRMRQEAYESETRHGIEAGSQARWEEQIARELALN